MVAGHSTETTDLVEAGAAVDFGVERVELEPREVDELEALPLTNASDGEARGKEGFGDESMHFCY